MTANGISQWIFENEPQLRMGVFFGVLGAVALWEAARPRRARRVSRMVRWPANLGIVALNTVVLRLLFPVAAVGVAIQAGERGVGLFNVWELPGWLAVVLTVIILDFAIYLQHLMFHAVPVLWRLHRMHHADLDFDVTTGARFHPVEIVLSMGIKIGLVILLGAPAVGVVIFEIILNMTAMFNHGNIKLPESVDRVLRLFVVTPDMHRVHHSRWRMETDSNYGFNLPWWDRLCGTYRAQPVDGHEGMTIGIEDYQDASYLRLDRMLAQPFYEAPNADAIKKKREETRA